MNGEKLRDIIESRNVRKGDLATALGISPQSLAQLFQVQDVKSGTVEKLADFLGVSIGSLYGCDTDVVNNNISYAGANARAAFGDAATVGVDPEIVNKLLDELAETRKQNAHLVELLVNR